MTTTRPVRVILVGSSGVGKTTVTQRLRGEAADATLPTIGINFVFYDLPDGTLCQIFDMAGNSDATGWATPNFARNVDGVLLMYDVTRRATFDALRTTWLPYLLRHAPLHASCQWLKGPVLVVGNKMDLVRRYERGERAAAGRANAPAPRAVSREELAALVTEYNLAFGVEASALTWSPEEDQTPFDALFKMVLENRPPQEIPDKKRLRALGSAPRANEGQCNGSECAI